MQVAELIRVNLGLRRDIPVSKVVFISFVWAALAQQRSLPSSIISNNKFRRLSGSQLLGGLDVKKTVRPINLVEPLRSPKIKENFDIFANNMVYEL